MNENLIQKNECLIKCTIVNGNPSILETDEFYDQKGHYKVELGVPTGTKAEEKVNAALKVALDFGHDHVFEGYSLVAPKLPYYEGNDEALRRPNAKDMLVIRTKTNSKPLLIGIDGSQNVTEELWGPGAVVKACIAFYPYKVNGINGVSANVKFMALVEEAKPKSILDVAKALLANVGDDD